MLRPGGQEEVESLGGTVLVADAGATPELLRRLFDEAVERLLPWEGDDE